MVKYKMPLENALVRATEIKAMLEPYCEQVVIAGSIRRQKELVGDIELVCQPRYVRGEQLSLFGDAVVSEENQLLPVLKQMAKAGVIKPRKQDNGVTNIAWFPTTSKEPRQISAIWGTRTPVDIFIVNADRVDWWGCTLWLRTGPGGPGQANTIAVTPQYQGGLRPNNVRLAGGIIEVDGEPFPVRTEKEMFKVLEMVYVAPHQRTVEAYKVAHWRYRRVSYPWPWERRFSQSRNDS